VAEIFARTAGPGLPQDRELVSALLTRGGDERIEVAAESGLNAYGCGPRPQSAGLEFSSSTASTISTAAFEAVVDRFRELRDERRTDEPAREVRRRLASLCGLAAEAADDIILAASGTDLHLIAATLAHGASGRALVSITAEPAESGRGVPKALEGRPFAARPPYGGAGTARAHEPLGQVMSVPLREPDGALRSPELVDRDVEIACARAVRARRSVLLVVLDVSKTGLAGPSADCAERMKRRFGTAVEVLVDACQFRLSVAALRRHLARGFLVAVTGSKFLAGPAFSGALFIPQAAAERMRRAPPARVLADHASRAEWPAGYAARAFLPEVANLGLVLRWEAALHELAAFRAADPERVAAGLEALTRSIDERLAGDPGFEHLERPGLGGAAAGAPATIFPFLLRRGGGLLDAGATRRAYLAAAEAQAGARGARFGQPVVIGRCKDQELAALRLALSAGQLVRAASSDAAAAELRAAIGEAFDTLTAAVQRI
jgi:hypothetical protein